jgi:transposase
VHGLVEGAKPRESGLVPAPRKYNDELRERAQRLVREAREQEPALSLNAAVLRIGPRVGVNPDTLRGWCKQADVDAGRAPGTTTTDAATIKQLQAEVRELKRANEILLAASSFVARELDPRLPW